MIRTIINAFGPKVWRLVGPAVIPTLYMAGSAAALTLVVGMIFGNLLFLTRPGGLGDPAVRYGYARFQGDVLLACVIVLFVIIQLVQLLGDPIVKRLIKKWHI
jgi:D-methionine transport system permease protein